MNASHQFGKRGKGTFEGGTMKGKRSTILSWTIVMYTGLYIVAYVIL